VTLTGAGYGSKAESRRATLGICVVRMGSIERGSLVSGYRWYDGYSVLLDGRKTYPWLPFRQACALANHWYGERSCRLMDDDQ